MAIQGPLKSHCHFLFIMVARGLPGYRALLDDALTFIAYTRSCASSRAQYYIIHQIPYNTIIYFFVLLIVFLTGDDATITNI